MFVDAVGNRMVVDTNASTHDKDSAQPVSRDAAPTSPVDESKTLSFGGEVYEDADAVQSDMDEREQDRFFVVPDGSGQTQTLTPKTLGVDSGTSSRAPGPTLPAVAITTCGWAVRLPLVDGERHARHELSFPVVQDGRRYAGYLLPAESGAIVVSLWSYVQKQGRAAPLLAFVDNDGKVIAVVNNFATESIPETLFRYGRVGGSMALDPPLASGSRVAVLDGPMVQRALPPACRTSASAGLGQKQPGGLVTLEFSGSTGN